jgi:hypothetical protein
VPSTTTPYEVATGYTGEVEMSPDNATWEAFAGSVPDTWTEVFFRYRPTTEDDWTEHGTPLAYSTVPTFSAAPEPTGAGAWDLHLDPLTGSVKTVVTGATTGTVTTAWDVALAMPRNTSGSQWTLTFEVWHRETGKVITAAIINDFNGNTFDVATQDALVNEYCDGGTSTIWAYKADGYGTLGDLVDTEVPC